MQAVVLLLIFGVVIFTSYHLLRSAAFAVCAIPKSSYIRCSSALTLFLAIGVCFIKVVFIIFTILYSVGAGWRFISSRLILLTWYFNACTLVVPKSS